MNSIMYIFLSDSLIITEKTRSETKLYFLGKSVTEVTGRKFPSLRMALGFFLHQHLEWKKTIRESSAVTITEIVKF